MDAGQECVALRGCMAMQECLHVKRPVCVTDRQKVAKNGASRDSGKAHVRAAMYTV